MALLAGWVHRQPVVWRGIQRLRSPVMAAYSIPALPCLVGAWLLLRRGASR